MGDVLTSELSCPLYHLVNLSEAAEKFCVVVTTNLVPVN